MDTRKFVNNYDNKEIATSGISLDSAEGLQITMDSLENQGIGMEPNIYLQMVMDAMPATGVTTATNQVPVQFLQHWMNRFITAVTQATKADEFMGRTTVGEWFQEEVVLRVRELTGSVRPYGDHAQPPLAGYNWNMEARTIVRFSQGIMTGALEEQRLAALGQKASAYESDRAALALAFRLNTNAVAFFGYNLGRNKTYGLLNDPNLADYIQVPQVALSDTETTTKWEDKDFYEIVRDLTVMVSTLQAQCKGNFDPRKDAFKFGIRCPAPSTWRRSTSTVTRSTSSSTRLGPRLSSSTSPSSTALSLATMSCTSSSRLSTATLSLSRLSLRRSASSVRFSVPRVSTSSTPTLRRAASLNSLSASCASSASNKRRRKDAKKGLRLRSGLFFYFESPDLTWRESVCYNMRHEKSPFSTSRRLP